MSHPIIRVENLGKKYTLSHQEKASTFRDALTQRLSNPFRRSASKPNSGQLEEFWALKDVSFEVQQGDRVGIIGRNGAGKSTLLKILSRITAPTKGEIRIRGRVASLLEVGTGFHPELTGRENIFLNGAILGMSKAEIKRKFDEIVAFAEVEKFIDTPVKRYSSGMYVRLAFAVAAHLEPEILIVDEVLAVGDTAFQKKCIGKMQDVADQGRTVLFVSHSIAPMRKLCSKAILLAQGAVIKNDTFEKALHEYLKTGDILTGHWKLSADHTTDQEVYFTEITIRSCREEPSNIISSNKPFYIDVSLEAQKSIFDAQIHIRITNQEGIPILTTANTDAISGESVIKKGQHTYRLNMPASFLQPGIYSLIVAILIPGQKVLDSIDSRISFTIEDVGTHATIFRDGRLGVVTPILDWQEQAEFSSLR